MKLVEKMGNQTVQYLIAECLASATNLKTLAIDMGISRGTIYHLLNAGPCTAAMSLKIAEYYDRLGVKKVNRAMEILGVPQDDYDSFRILSEMMLRARENADIPK